MRIAAVADVHSPRFFIEFTNSLAKCKKPDLFLLAGDIVNRGKSDEYPRVVNAIERIHGDVPIIACFGNEEYIHTRSEITSLIGDRVTFVDESTTVKLISGSSIGVVGASTLIDKSVDLSEIRMIFENRAEKISQLLQEVAKDSDHTILLLHYSPLLERHTDPESFSWWVSKAVGTTKLSLVIHGHLHDSPKHKVMIGATPVFNVALPAVGSITELTL